MLGVLAYYHDVTFSFYDLAFFANLFYGRLHFHWLTPFLSIGFLALTAEIKQLFGSPCDAALAEVVHGYLNLDLVTYKYLYTIQPQLARYARSYHVTVFELHLEGCIRQCGYNNTAEFHYIVLRQNDPSFWDYMIFSLAFAAEYAVGIFLYNGSRFCVCYLDPPVDYIFLGQPAIGD